MSQQTFLKRRGSPASSWSLVKLAIITCLARAFGLRWLTGLQAGLLLGPGGEFGFVILGLARAEEPDQCRKRRVFRWSSLP